MSNRTDFSFAMNIAKSASADTNKMVIRGVASGTLRDRQGDKFSVKGLEAIKKSIEDGLVDPDSGEWSQIPLRSGHRTEWEDVLGYVTKSWLDPEQNLWIEAELDEDSGKAQELYRKLTKGKVKLGLSVRGQVTEYHHDFDPDIQKAGVFFDNLLTKEISVTSQPVYPMPYPIAIAKSLTNDPQYQEGLEEFMSKQEVSKATGDDYQSLPARENDKAANSEPVEQAVESKQEAGVVDANNQNTTQTQQSDPRTEASQAVVRGLVGDNAADKAADPENVRQAEEPQTQNANAGNEEPARAEAGNDYIAAPTGVEGTQQEASQQENSDAVADPAQSEDTSLRGAVSDIAAAVGTLAKAVENLQTQVDDVKKSGTQEVQKAESEATPKADTGVQLSPENLQTNIASAVKAAFDDLGLTKIMEDVEVMKSAVSDMSGQPVDKSISVQKAKDEQDNNDPLVRYRRLIDEGEDPIMAATSAGFNRGR